MVLAALLTNSLSLTIHLSDPPPRDVAGWVLGGVGGGGGGVRPLIEKGNGEQMGGGGGYRWKVNNV